MLLPKKLCEDNLLLNFLISHRGHACELQEPFLARVGLGEKFVCSG